MTIKRLYFLLLAFILCTAILPAQETYDMVITNGRVMDPETGLNAVMNVGINGDRIVKLTIDDIKGIKIIDASGLVVSPGFIDISTSFFPYEDSYFGAEYWKMQDGVTTVLYTHNGHGYASTVMKKQEPLPHYINWGIGVCLTHYPLNDPEKLMKDYRANIEAGAISAAVSPEYYPNVTTEMLTEWAAVAREYNLWFGLHTRYSHINNELKGISEAIDVAEDSGGHVHIFHITSTGATYNADKAIEMINDARNRGVNIDADVYSFTFWMTFLNSSRFAPGWRKGFGLDYEDIYFVRIGDHLTEETFNYWRKQGARSHAIVPEGTISLEKSLLPVLAQDWVSVGSDGQYPASKDYPYAWASHPRETGNFARAMSFVHKYDIPLMKMLRKVTLDNAKLMESASDRFKLLGRLQQNCIADITIFNPDTIDSQGEILNPMQESKGVEYVIVNGTLVYKHGQALEFGAGKLIRNNFAAGK